MKKVILIVMALVMAFSVAFAESSMSADQAKLGEVIFAQEPQGVIDPEFNFGQYPAVTIIPFVSTVQLGKRVDLFVGFDQIPLRPFAVRWLYSVDDGETWRELDTDKEMLSFVLVSDEMLDWVFRVQVTYYDE